MTAGAPGAAAGIPDSSRTAVKICGIRSAETLQAMLHLPVDYVGFVFAKSKRQVTPQEAERLIAYLRQSGVSPDLFRTVGVFVNPAPDMLEETLRHVPLDAVQLHGGESADYCRWVKETFRTEVWRSISIAAAPHGDGAGAAEEGRRGGDTDTSPAVLLPDAYRGAVDVILLDTAGGGTGRTFDWRAIPAYAGWCRARGIRLFVAGGLHPGNVGDLLDAYRPDGVDVSSGVETEGNKDPEKIIRFVERVKR